MKYVFSFITLIALVSIVPIFIPSLPNTMALFKVLKLCKIARLVKMSRYIGGIHDFGEAVVKKKKIIYSLIMQLLFLVLYSILLYAFEHESQPTLLPNELSRIKIASCH